MGCWNATCGLSGLPILYHDPVVAVLIAYNPDATEATAYCYPYDHAKPWSLPFRGQYNDYGGIEELTQLPVDLPSLQAEYKFTDFEKWVNDRVTRNEVMAYANGMGKAGMGLWLAHADIYDALAKPAGVAGVLAVLAELRRIETSGEAAREKFYFRSWKLGAGFREGYDDTFKRAVHDLRRALQGQYRPFHWAAMFDDFNLDDAVLTRQLVTGLAELYALNESMMTLRRSFGPRPVCSQADDWLEHAKFAETVAGFARKRQAEWDREYGDTPENEEST